MKTTTEKLAGLQGRFREAKIKILILGLGSVGNYLLDYLISTGDPQMEIGVAGRNEDKMMSDVNIVRVASLIRGQSRTGVKVMGGVDLNDVASIERCLSTFRPDIIVNSSRAYSGLKYGSISWNSIRAYGIWAPLAVKYIRNIMQAYRQVASDAIVINTSYSDAVNPWLKSAGMDCPDYGSGNINHLIPRIKYAVAEKCCLEDYWNIDVSYATSHFHDVVISKEGQTEGVSQLLEIQYGNKRVDVNQSEIFAGCKIPMPVDVKRNMMNASSNYEIILAILAAVREKRRKKLHCPGVFGEIGGYPVIIDGTVDQADTYIDEAAFTLADMQEKNRESIYLDGIENIQGGTLYYTDELLYKVKRVFDVTLPKAVPFDAIEPTAQLLITEIIEKNKGK